MKLPRPYDVAEEALVWLVLAAIFGGLGLVVKAILS